MDVLRRFSLFVTAGLLAVALMIGWVNERPAVSANAANALASAGAYFDSTAVLARDARPVGSRGDELAVALGYLERLRLGVGSPFRLVDEAARDPRLGPVMSNRVQWALIARLRRGDAYIIDPAVLDGAGPWTASGFGATGAAHLALIEHAIHSASDPRAGELAIRLAYLVESAKSSLSPSAVTVATQVAAQVRDHELAVADVRDLLADANSSHADALQLLATRRAERSLRVEQPPLAPLDEALQVEAMNAVPALVAALDTLDRTAAPAPPGFASTPVLGPQFAARLAALAAQRPPVSQVVVTLRSQAHAGFTATNEESLIAGYEPTTQAADSVRRSSALALLATTVSLRALSQQQPWFPGDAGPTTGDLATEFGVASVTFARSVPIAWRPFYLLQLQTALRDMHGVLPMFAVDGMHIRFGVDALPDSALAMHDPRTRTIQLSISTSGGTLAHELSHDMDFQASKRLFAEAGGYSTDRAMIEKRGALAQSLRGLAEARVLRPAPPGAAPSTDRPAELFARSSDWFVASMLAQHGVMNGYLSAIQDEMLPGYAAGFPTAVGTSGAQSLTSAIDAVTYLPDSSRVAFESQWSDPDVVDPVLVVRRVLETPVSWRGAVTSGFDSPLELCSADRSTAGRARERLLMRAVKARAEGMAKRRSGARGVAGRPDWANGLRGVAPYSPEPGRKIVDRYESSIIAALSSAVGDQGVLPVVPAIFRSSSASCSTISR
ncbi:MAG TPA: hypothetical protein VGM67_03925 [Gemmatimonadaceae bacterium]|jgi:hypothetical protein